MFFDVSPGRKSAAGGHTSGVTSMTNKAQSSAWQRGKGTTSRLLASAYRKLPARMFLVLHRFAAHKVARCQGMVPAAKMPQSKAASDVLSKALGTKESVPAVWTGIASKSVFDCQTVNRNEN